MTFRDDHEAALQRASALESELAKKDKANIALERERDRLAAEREQLVAERDALRAQTRKETSQPSTTTLPPWWRRPYVWIVVGIGAVCTICLVLAVVAGSAQDERATAQQARPTRPTDSVDWFALRASRTCLQRSAVVDLGLFAKRRAEDLHTAWQSFYLTVLGSTCGEQLLAVLPPTSPFVERARELQAVETKLGALTKAMQEHYRMGDHIEDAFASVTRQWADLDTLLSARRAIVKRMFDDALFAELETLVRRQQARVSNRPDKLEVWWRIELSFDLARISTIAVRASGALDGRQDLVAVLAAVHEPIRQVRDRASKAPIEVRRALRQTSLHYADSALEDLSDNFLLDLSTLDMDILSAVTPNDLD